jgi:hypothetical protein
MAIGRIPVVHAVGSQSTGSTPIVSFLDGDPGICRIARFIGRDILTVAPVGRAPGNA